MSRLEDLIQELCPAGVEYRTIKDTVGVNRGKRLTKSQLLEEGIYEVYHGSKDSILGKYNHYNAPANTTIVVNTGGIGGVKFLDKPFWCSDGSFWLGQAKFIDNKFLYYYLSGYEDYFYSQKRVGGVPTIDKCVVENFKIPVPPLPVQEEIVRILDGFTALTAELQAELQARKKQYEYYSSQLFPDMCGSNCEWVSLEEIATVTKLAGFEFTNFVSYSDEGRIIALRGLNVKDGHLNLEDVKYIDQSNLEMLSRSKLFIGDMLFTYVGTIGQVALINENDKYYLAPNVALIRLCDNRFIPKFMMYYFLTNKFRKEQISKLLQSSSMPNIPMVKIRKFKLPLISISEQERIVSILDRFDALCNDLTSGLPAEIEARQKQYEYYRDKLLTFKEKGA